MEQRAIRGIPWTLLSYAANRVVTVLTTLVLARLLVPADFGLFALALLGYALTAASPVGMFVFLFAIGATGAALSPAIQTRLMDVAGDSQTLAAAVNHSAFNIGNSLGAALGGVVVAAGLGYVAPAWLGLVACAAGVLLVLLSVLTSRRARAVRPSTVPRTQPIPLPGL